MRAWSSGITWDQIFSSLLGTKKAVKATRDFMEERIKVEVRKDDHAFYLLLSEPSLLNDMIQNTKGSNGECTPILAGLCLSVSVISVSQQREESEHFAVRDGRHSQLWQTTR